MTKTEPTFTGASLTTISEHHYVPPPNLILKDFGDRENTPSRPLIVSTLKVVFTSPNPDAALHILVGFSSILDIGLSSSNGYIHISTEAFKKLLAHLDVIQETQANIQLTQQQLIQRVDDLTMVVQ